MSSTAGPRRICLRSSLWRVHFPSFFDLPGPQKSGVGRDGRRDEGRLHSRGHALGHLAGAALTTFWAFFWPALALALPLIVPRLDCLERVGFAHAQLRRGERSWVRPAGVWIRPAAGHHWRPLPSRRGHDWIIFFGPTTACCAERLGSPCTHRTLAAGPARIAGGQDQLPIPAKRALRSVRAVPCGRSALFHPQITRQCHFVDEHGPVCRRQVRQPHALPVQPASGAPWH